MCCARLAENTGRKKSPKSRHLGTIPQLCRAISSQLRHVSTSRKNLLSSNISSTSPHNMVNFGPLAAETVSLVWGTPAYFNGFRVLVALLHCTLVLRVGRAAITLGIGPHSSSFFFSSPNLSGRSEDVYHTSAHGLDPMCEFRMQV